MTTLTSPTNESYSVAYSDPNRLEMSGLVGSTPPASSIDHQNTYLHFEEYVNDDQRPKNPLVITVEDSFDCKMIDAPGMRHTKKQGVFEPLHTKNQDMSLLIEYREKIDTLTHRILELEEKVFYFEDYNGKLMAEVEVLKETTEVMRETRDDYAIRHEHHKQLIRKMDEVISGQKDAIDKLNSKLSELEKENHNGKFFQEKTKEKDVKIRQLMKKIDKLLMINKSLEGEIKQGNDKLITLEREAQLSAYNQIQQNRVKLKQSMSVINKENVEDNFRKSFENAQQRRGRLSNISAIEKKTKSNSNIGRMKH